ncbi:hypothetical protein PR048_000118 [Dryococelus australis]|uniref:Small EDRK-rich factor-like N-terminal domain-containing protein n=1 Tax=Dryococelus australis TaxID=614101 RepID=A0ABQ9IDW7_9NEOP|nr:hypothetical protein PR048_000118 [Dryococelus australis]
MKNGEITKRKERARAEKQKGKDKALADNSVVIHKDLQAEKLAQISKASALYYKIKLCVHNYTIYNLKTHSVLEGELKTSNFVSCLVDLEIMSNWPQESPN